MAHLNFAKDINEIVRMDGPMQGGPLMRWQRKAQETSLRVHDGGSSPLKNKARTPGKGIPNSSFAAGAKTPKSPGCKTPGGKCGENVNGSRSGKKTKTPSNKTPGRQQDRFIPCRSTTDMEFGHYAMMKRYDDSENEPVNTEESKAEYQDQLKEALEVKDCKILNFRTKAPTANSTNNLHVLYSCGKVGAKQSTSTRFIPKDPDRILDAPELLDDYYLNLMDWSQSNILTVALGNGVFLWNADSGAISELMELSTPEEYITCVSWVQEGAVLGVGLSSGVVQLWDTDNQKLIRSMSGHASRVGSLSWNAHVLSSGSRTGAIHHHDVRVANHHIASLENHTQEVCGLKWSPDGKFLASGGNDNLVNIWSNQMSSAPPMFTLTDHQAAVKAMSWCPWKPYLLASGGGTADRHIRLWNIQSGSSVGAYDTESQVCSILWSSEHKELISGHGYALNHLRIWKYPTMTKVVDLVGHNARVLCMALSPDGSTVASAAADETIRLWKCFAVDKQTKKTMSKPEKKMTSGLSMCIR
ncbi:ubiquitin-protein transferase activating protein [Bulinus truncatus]|nr:ubiquitin-protein transferase activating protein [Bulinus truncatus]